MAVRNLSTPREVALPEGMLTRDAHALVVNDPDIDVVVEVIGGIEPARELITTALRNGKPVVTANKELLANVGTELFAVADEAGVDLLFEAAVAGGIPVIRALRESLRGEPISRVMGIINGTTNFILTKMTEEGTDYAVALAEAQALGFAERDPTADVEGFDAGAKAAIIATIAFGAKVVAGDVYHEGISGIIAARHRHGQAARVRGEAARHRRGRPRDRRHRRACAPHDGARPPSAGQCARQLQRRVRRGRRRRLADVLRPWRRWRPHGQRGARRRHRCRAQPHQRHARLAWARSAGRTSCPIDETSAEYLLSLDVADRPGVLHAVTGVFARHDVSIRAAEQEGNAPDARLVFITHVAKESAMQATVRELRDARRGAQGRQPAARDRRLTDALRLHPRHRARTRLHRRAARRACHRRRAVRARRVAGAACP